MKEEIRFSAGTINGLRSTVWKLIKEDSNDIYLMSRMMGSDTKISFHKDRRCQFSFTDQWVKGNLGKRIDKNKERHLVEPWIRENPGAGEAIPAFRLVIPATELRHISYEKRLSKVKWLPLPQMDELLLVDFYFKSVEQNCIEYLHHDPIVVWELSDSSWFVAISHIEKITTTEAEILSASRLKSRMDFASKNIPVLPQCRASAFFTHELGFNGIIEMVL